VDQPPLIALIAWFSQHVFGSSLLGLRLLPAIAGAALVWLTGRLTREMGGGRFAQALAALAALAVPIFLVFHHWLTMNAFEPLIWMAAAWCVVRAINTSDVKYWLWFGVLIGLGLETKYTVIFFAFGIVVGLLLSSHRRFLKSKWIWLGAVAALLIFLPNLLWLVKHDFPFLQLMHNIRQSGRDVARGPIAFIADQAMIMNPILAPLWVAGLVWLFFGGRKARRQEQAAGAVPPTAPAPVMPSPTYSEFSDVLFNSRPATPVRHVDEYSCETDSLPNHHPSDSLSSPNPHRRHYSVVVGRRTGIYASWYLPFSCNSCNKLIQCSKELG